MAKSVAIDFSGVMMFVLYDDRIEVLIPNCEAGHLSPDEPGAQPHWAWLTSPKPGKSELYVLREALIGADIEIRGDSRGDRDVTGFDYVFRINEMVAGPTGGNPPNRDPRNLGDRQFVATRIRLYGGALIAEGVDPENGCRNSYGGQELISPRALIWQSRLPEGIDSLRAKLSLGNGASRNLDLPAESEIAIWNLDYRVPEDWKPQEDMKDQDLVDTDFRWNYHAYGLNAGEWAPILEAGRLPAPVFLGPFIKTAGSCHSCKPCLLDVRTNSLRSRKPTRP